MQSKSENYHEGRDAASGETGRASGETWWNDEACLALARSLYGPQEGSPAARIDDFLISINDIALGKLAALLGLSRKAQQFIEPIADLTISDVLIRARDRVQSEVLAELDR